MRYNWVDYTSAHKEIVEPWIDEETKRFTGCDEGFDAYYQYWANEPETELGRNFWAKLIIAEVLAESEEILGVMITDASAVIYPNNIPSQKAFEKAGFVFHSQHPDGDAWNYWYKREQEA